MEILRGIPDQICVNVLGYKEDGIWCAHAVDMDIVGCGKTFDEAFEEVKALVEAQVSFAVFKRDPSLLWRTAPPEILEKFHSVFMQPNTERLASRATETLASFPVPPAWLAAQANGGFDIQTSRD